MGVIRTVVAVGALALSVPVYAQGGRFGGDRSRSEQKNDNRGDDHGDDRGTRGAEPRKGQRGRPAEPWNRGDERADRSRYETRGNGRGNGHAYGRRDRDDRDRDNDRGYRRGYDRRVYDYDRGRREAVFIGGWFRVHGVSISIRSHMASRDRYEFRRGLSVDPFVLTRLELLPFDLELELGDLPPYYERRMYGRTVLVIDLRTRMVVDVFDVDW